MYEVLILNIFMWNQTLSANIVYLSLTVKHGLPSKHYSGSYLQSGENANQVHVKNAPKKVSRMKFIISL